MEREDQGPEKKNYYEILGVPSNAGPGEIKKAYIELAREYHPDKRPGDKDVQVKFAEITQAYRVLSDTASRYAYDLELGIEPGELVVPTHERIEHDSVTGTAVGDYVESVAGGIPIPTLHKLDEETYEFKGLDNPKIRKAYESGVFSIGTLEKLEMRYYYELGVSALSEKKFDVAIAYCIEAVRINPRNLQFRFSLGCCFEAKGFLGEATEEYEQTLKLASGKGYTCLPVREALISLYLKLKKFSEVKKQCGALWDLRLTSTVAERALHMVYVEERRESNAD